MDDQPDVAPLKRVLIITYYWPPSGGSGVQRWLKFAKYLPTFGWQPVVVAPKDADYPVFDHGLSSEVDPQLEVLRLPIWEPYAIYRKLTGSKPGDNLAVIPAEGSSKPGLLKRLSLWVRANFFVPDPRIFWVKPSIKELSNYLSKNPVDAIVSTGPPHSVHLIAQKLKAQFPDVKWILDVRDPWSQFDVHLAFNPGKRARKKNAMLERKALKEADFIVGTAYSMPTHLEPFDQSKYRTVTNGYDATDFEHVKQKAKLTSSKIEKFHIYHTGLLNAIRNPKALWQSLEELLLQDHLFAERLHVYLIGTVADEVKRSIQSHKSLQGKYTITPWMPHDELIGHYEDADLFLLCPNRTDNAKGQINGKLFEYLATNKPILHVGPFDADNTRLLDETHAGLTVPPNDAVAIKDAVLRIYNGTFSANENALLPERSVRFERKALTGQLVEILEGS